MATVIMAPESVEKPQNDQHASLREGAGIRHITTPISHGIPRAEAAQCGNVSAASAVDLTLMHRVQQGETAAFDQLVERYQGRIAAVLAQYIRDPGELEDVAQETFLKAYRALDRFRGESAFYTWLYRIAVNTAKNHLDAMGRRVGRDGVDPGEAERDADGTWLRHDDTPESAMRCSELLAVIEHTLAELPTHLHEALLLRELDGLSYQAIATVAGCPLGTVRSRIARARTLIDTAAATVVEPSELSSQRLRSAG